MGAYVSQLDRPWTDTPFLFQGFVIEEEEQLQVLRRLCKVVYVEVSRAEAEAPAATQTPPPVAGSKSPTSDAVNGRQPAPG